VLYSVGFMALMTYFYERFLYDDQTYTPWKYGQDLARETNLQETTFVFPRDPATEREEGVKVRASRQFSVNNSPR
jgi:hypothetical protein